MFPHIKSTDSVVDRCTHALQKAILRGQLLPGDKLPPERDLATQFGVNRVTVRGALARLQVAGLVSVRQGSGYRVRDYRVHGGMDLIASVLSETEDSEALEGALGDLLTIRRSMAMALLNRLSRGILPEDLRNVSRAIDALDAVAASGAEPGALAEADGAILRALIEATRSPVLGLCINPILQLLASQPRLCRAIFSRPAESLVSWRLFEAWLTDPTSLPVDQILHHLERQDRHTLARMRALS